MEDSEAGALVHVRAAEKVRQMTARSSRRRRRRESAAERSVAHGSARGTEEERPQKVVVENLTWRRR